MGIGLGTRFDLEGIHPELIRAVDPIIDIEEDFEGLDGQGGEVMINYVVEVVHDSVDDDVH